MKYLNYPKLIEDIDNKILKDRIVISKFCTQNGLSKSTIYRIKRHTPMNMATFLFFVNWIGSDPSDYFGDNLDYYEDKPKRDYIKNTKKEVNPILGY